MKKRSWYARWTPSFRVGAVLVGLICLGALLAALAVFGNPDEATSFLNRFLPPSPQHPLGTDHLARDLLARVAAGAQNALFVGLVAVGIGLSLGSLLGILAGYMGGWFDQVTMFLLDTLYAFPALLLALLFAAILGPGTTSSMIAIGLAAVPAFARLARAGVLAVRSLPYLESAQALGASHIRILWIHVLPNIVGPLVVQASLAFAGAILAEAALSYLGLGTQPPTASWGRMLREAQSFLLAGLSIHPTLWPGLAIAVAVLGFNLIGDGLRDLLDPRHRAR